MSRRPLLSVIIPVYNGESSIRACLRSVFESGYRPFEVIVVDDGSRDGTPAAVREFPVVSSVSEENRGAAFSRNLGAAKARGDILFFLDADIVIESCTLGMVVGTFESRPGISALFCSYGKEAGPRNFSSVYKNLLHHYTHQISDERAVTFCGGFGAVRKEVFFRVGGFDERHRSLEDMELGYRLHRAGFAIFLNKKIQVTHLKRYSLGSLVRSDLFQRALPWTRIMLENRIWRNDLNTRVEHVLSVPVSFLMLLSPLAVFERPGGWASLPALLTALFLLLNGSFFLFLYRERGALFTLRAIFMHWFHYLYSGVGFAMGVLMFIAERLRKRPLQPV